jgi:hypothetical protein
MASPASTLAQTLTRTTARLRPALRRAALPLTVGLTTGLVAVHHQRPMRFDYAATTKTRSSSPLASSVESPKRKEDLLDPEMIRQMSGGSLSGEMSPYLVPDLVVE